MMFFVKLMSLLVYPLTQSLLAMVLALVSCRRVSVGLARVLLGASLLWLWIWSMPLVADRIVGSLEWRYPAASADSAPQADAILVLGGCVTAPRLPRVDPDLASSADRLWHAARLYHAGRAPLIVASGGNLPWLNASMSEAEAMRAVLVAFGVPASAVQMETASANTRENMQRSKAMLDQLGTNRVLLVTSALHMRRALAEARLAGIDAVPAAADYTAEEGSRTLLDVLPDADALRRSSLAIKEYVGCWMIRGCQ
jgi:uncharacterized SAM-binding protein YcdF (DUF218 family)